MAGKAYTMREMKGIVDYLVEHKAYNEIKGRKMWMTFASSQMTTRTWQSLKETFLKRILPDIHNPYYKLTMEQARSFKEGRDVEAKERNKLEIQHSSDSSISNNGENKKNNEQPSTSKALNEEADIPSGEDIKCAKIPSENRSSVDTVVLEAYYNNAEEIKNVLENSIDDSEKNEEEYNKNIRDCLTFEYSPFNIDAMKVLEDFASESEGSEKGLRMDIAEEPTNTQNNNKPESKSNNNDDDPIEIHDSDTSDLENNEKEADEVDQLIEELNKHDEEVTHLGENQKETTGDQDKTTKDQDNTTKDQFETTEGQDKATENQDKSVEKTNQRPKSPENLTILIDSTENSDSVIPPNKTASSKKSIDPIPNSNTTQNATNSTDTSLPNNQEALNGVANSQSKLNTSEEKTNEKISRKRSTSTDTNNSKKLKLDNENSKKTDATKPSTKEILDVTANNNEPNNQDKSPAKAQINEDSSKNEQEPTNNDEIKENPCLNSVSLYAEQFNTTKYIDSGSEEETVNQSKPQEDTVNITNETQQTSAEPENTKAEHNNKPSNSPELNNKTKPLSKTKNLNQVQAEIDNKSAEEQINKSKEPKQTKLSLKRANPSTDTKSSKDDILVLKSHSESISDDDSKPSCSKGNVTIEKNKKEIALANMLGFSVGGKRKRKISHKRIQSKRHSTTVISDSSEYTSESNDDEYVSPPRGRNNRRKYLKPKSARILSLDEDGGLFVIHRKRMFPVVKDGKNVKSYVAINSESSEEEQESYWKQKYVEQKIRADELEKRLKEANVPIQQPDLTLERKSPILQSSTLLRNISSHKALNESVGNLPKIKENGEASPKKHSSQEKLKICFSKNNQEVQLEGYWSTLHPALQQVVELLHTEEDTTKTKPLRRPSAKKDDKGAKKTDKPATNGTELDTVEIDSGKTTPIIPTVDPEVHEKISKIENEIFKEIQDLESKANIEEQETKPIEENSNVTKRSVRGRPKKSAPSTSKAKTTKKEKSPNLEAKDKKDSTDKIDEKQNEVNEPTNVEIKPKENVEQNGTVNVTENIDDNISIASRRSSRASKRFSVESAVQNRVTTRRSASKKTEPVVEDEDSVRYMLPPDKTEQTNKRAKRSLAESCTQEASLRSIDSTQGYQDSDISPIKTKRKKKERKLTVRVQSSKLKRRSMPNLTDLFSSESSNSSYFVPIRKSQSTINSEVYKTDSYQLLLPQQKNLKLESIAEDEVRHFNSVSKSDSDSNYNIIVEVGSSSNVSLPMSPELSVVENLTVSRESIKTITLNEACNIGNKNLEYDKYVMSGVDVSYPLMATQCELQQTNIKSPNDIINPPAIESLNEKVARVNIQDKSISDTINKKLHDLLLESAKKITNDKENMEVDESTEIPKKTRAKRCSTPRKKKVTKKKAEVNSIIEEEHTESCSFGRKSCPPQINIITPDDNASNFNETVDSITKGKKKQDLLKVKIQRPRSRNKSRNSKDTTKTSSLTDSGINDTGCISATFLKGHESIDLIHNHSDTCLNANECIGDSIEFVDNSKLIISLNNSSDSELIKLMDDAESFSDVLEYNNAQDGFGKRPIPEENFYSATATEYHSPVNTNSSLITEDLSDEILPQPTKWYLLSEDDTNTNIPQTSQNTPGFGANLNKIFTSCAVPNLSTITEKSNDSRKYTDGNTDT